VLLPEIGDLGFASQIRGWTWRLPTRPRSPRSPESLDSFLLSLTLLTQPWLRSCHPLDEISFGIVVFHSIVVMSSACVSCVAHVPIARQGSPVLMPSSVRPLPSLDARILSRLHSLVCTSSMQPLPLAYVEARLGTL
jgi:hypothetical protein